MPKTVPSFPFSLSYDTAACLEHIINAQSVIAVAEKENGNESLSESIEKLNPFWMALIRYLENPTK